MAESHLAGGRGSGDVTEVMGNDVFAITPTAEHVMGVAGLGPLPAVHAILHPSAAQQSPLCAGEDEGGSTHCVAPCLAFSLKTGNLQFP